MKQIEPSELADLVTRIFQGAGAPEPIARVVAESLVSSDLAGHESHGVIRVSQYLRSIAAGELDPAAEPVAAHATPTLVHVDGRRGFGQLGARFAMLAAVERAQTQGLAMAGLFNCNHVGRLGEWVQLAAEAGCIGMAFCNGGGPRGGVAPYGGATRLLGTNPIAAAVPVAGRPPIVVDFATSAVAEGKLRVARNRGLPIPEGWIVDAQGQPSTDPSAYYAGGALLPAAGHKGYGLSLLVELLGGLLTGAGSPILPGFSSGNGVLFLALAAGAFRPADAFLADAAALCAQVKAAQPAAGYAEVLLPGEPEQRAEAHRRAERIILDDATWAQLDEAVKRSA